MLEVIYTIMSVACVVAAITIFYLVYTTAESKALRKACEHCNAYLKELENKNDELQKQVNKAEQKSAMYYTVNRGLKDTLDAINSDYQELKVQWNTIQKAYDQLAKKVETFSAQADEMKEWESPANQLDIYSQINQAITKPME